MDYRISQALVEFIASKSIPNNLDNEVILELANQFDDYVHPWLLYAVKNPPQALKLSEVTSAVKAELQNILDMYDEEANMTDPEIQTLISNEYARIHKQYTKDIDVLKKSYVFEISADYKQVKVYADNISEDLQWAENAEDKFIEDFMDSWSAEDQQALQKDLEQNPDLSTAEIQEKLQLESFWKAWKPETRFYLYEWITDPNKILKDIIEVLTSFREDSSPVAMAASIYELMPE